MSEGILNDGGLLTLGQTAEAVGVSTITIRNWWSKGTFPPPLRPGGRMLRWRVDDVQAWIDSGFKNSKQEQGVANV